MEDSVRYSCDASFEHPSTLVFNGLKYEKTITPIDHLPGVTFVRVIACGQYQQDDDMEVEDEDASATNDVDFVDHNGPEFVDNNGPGFVGDNGQYQQDGDMEVDNASTTPDLDFVNDNSPELVGFNRFLYVKSDKAKAVVDDSILRTVADQTLFNPLQSVAIAAMSYTYVPPPAQAPVLVAPQQINVVPQQINNLAPRQPRVMPPRATVRQESALEPLFDLEPEERVGVAYIVPSHNNVIAPTTPGMIPNPRPGGRTTWKAEHVEYLDELLELALLKLNRPLLPKDFKAITEALHRHFRTNGGITERGYNTVHSHATRRRAYSSLVQRVLPDIGFPDYVRFKQG